MLYASSREQSTREQHTEKLESKIGYILEVQLLENLQVVEQQEYLEAIVAGRLNKKVADGWQ